MAKKAPSQFFAESEEPIELLAAAGEDKEVDDSPRKFRMVAYTGGLMRIAGFPRPVVVDLAGLEIPNQNLPIRLDHERRQGVGHTQRVVLGHGKEDRLARKLAGLILVTLLHDLFPLLAQRVAVADPFFQVGARVVDVVRLESLFD